VTLTCESLSRDNVHPREITWYRHYKLNDSFTNEKGEAYSTVLQTIQATQLDLINLQVNDSTYYSCKIANHFGATLSTAYIEVLESWDSGQLISSGLSIGPIVGLVVVSMVSVVLLVLCLYCCRKSRRSEKDKQLALENARTVAAWTKKVIVSRDLGEDLLQPLVRIEKVRIEATCEDDTIPDSEYEFPLDIEWEFPREKLVFSGVLGEGAFGKVVRATATHAQIMNGRLVESGETEAETTVAVKMVKEGHTDSDITDLVKEMEIMKVIGRHPNIINLVGVCSQPIGSPLLVVVEYARFGNLREFLKQRKPGTQEHLKEQRLRKAAARCLLSNNYLNTKNSEASLNDKADKDLYGETGPVSLKLMLSFALQVAKGMEFLSSRRAVHRDLAARNVLVADNFVLKIADFGMARDLQDSEYYRKESGGRLPIKWMAPESLFNGISTTMSDVWSFGILFWEIVTFGDTPYKQEYLPKVFMELIKNGYKMKQPLGCPDPVYSIMRKCWTYQPEDRPGWGELVESVYTLHINTHPDEYLDLNAPELDTPPSSPELGQRHTSLRDPCSLHLSESLYVIPDSRALTRDPKLPRTQTFPRDQQPLLSHRDQEGPLLSRRDSRSCPERRRARSEQSRQTGPRRDRSRSSGFEERREEGSEFGRTHHKYLDMPTVETENEDVFYINGEYENRNFRQQKHNPPQQHHNLPQQHIPPQQHNPPQQLHNPPQQQHNPPQQQHNPPQQQHNPLQQQHNPSQQHSYHYQIPKQHSQQPSDPYQAVWLANEETRPFLSNQHEMTELRSKPTLSVDIGAATQFSTEALYNSPAAYPANSPKYPVVYTALRVRADSTVIRPGEEGDGRTTEDRFSTFFPGLKRGSSESGYGTNRDSETSDSRYRGLPGIERIRHASDSDSVFLRNTPSPQTD